MKKALVKKTVYCVFFLALTIALMLHFSNIFENKTSRYAKEPLKEYGNQIDVLLAGSSHVQDNILPFYLWDECGITSYNIASSGEWIQVTYYEIKEALKYTTPKLVIVDVFRATDDLDENITKMPDGLIHEAIDYFAIDADKIELAKLAAKGKGTEMISFLSNFYAYHDRWKELDKSDFLEEYSLEKGALMLYGMQEFGDYDNLKPEYDEKVLLGTGYEYIVKIAELCNEKGVDCLFINVPYHNSSQGHFNREYTYLAAAKELGCKILYCPDYYDEIGLDSSLDFYDSGHYNAIGAKKMSVFLADYLAENMGMIDHRNDSFYSAYQNFAKDIENVRVNNAEKANNTINMAMAFYDSKKYEVSFYGIDNVWEKDEKLTRYMEFAGIKGFLISEADETIKESVLQMNDNEEIDDSKLVIVVKDINDDSIVMQDIFNYSPSGFIRK